MTHDDALMKKGLRVRTAVLGREHVRNSFTRGDEYTRTIAEVTTRVAWGMVWSRPGLSRKYRSLLNLGALIALGAGEQLCLRSPDRLTRKGTSSRRRKACAP